MVIICTIANIMKLKFPRTFSVLVSYDTRNNRVISLLIFNRLLLTMGTEYEERKTNKMQQLDFYY